MTITEKLTQLWDQLFTKIYVISHITQKDRDKTLIPELSRIGIWQTNKVQIIYNPINNLNYKLSKNFSKYIGKLVPFDQAMNHYTLINRCQQFGEDHILIIENDVRFLKDINIIYNLLVNMPDDYDIMIFDHCFPYEKYDEIDYNSTKYIRFESDDIKDSWSSSLYALSNKGMKAIVDYHVNFDLVPPDYVFIKALDVTKYYSEVNYCIQYIEKDNEKYYLHNLGYDNIKLNRDMYNL